MHDINFNTILHLERLKMEPDKKYICYCLLFCFYRKKNDADAHKIICKTYDENVIAIRSVRIRLNN